MIKYYIRLNTSNDQLLSDAFHLSKELHQQGKKSWFGCIKIMLQYINADESYILQKKTVVKNI